MNLNEIFTIDPTKEDDIHRVGNCVVASFVLHEHEINKKRVEVCGCGSCRGELKDSEDRMNWALGLGCWRMTERKQRRQRYDACEEEDGV